MKKVTLNSICFVLLFALIFACVQQVFIPKEADSVAIAQFYNEPPGSIDVLFIGPSDMMTAAYPAIMWDRAGISSYNLSLSGMNLPTQYYVLEEALRFQKPSVVIISGVSIFLDIDFDIEEPRFRKALDMMRWSSVKYESVLDILANSESQNFIDYLLPLLRYHDRRDFTANDFDFSFKRQRSMFRGRQGGDVTSFEPQEHPQALLETADTPELYDEYFVKIIELCRANGIEIIIVNPPTCDEIKLTMPRHIALTEFATAHNISYFNLNTPELYEALKIDASRDFDDILHLNISGATKVTEFLADYVSSTYNLPDRRQAPYDPHWDDVVEYYYKQYSEMLAAFT